jgi:hypothetical protein
MLDAVVEILESSDLYEKGAVETFVYCFALGFTEKEVTEKTKAELSEIGCNLIKVSSIIPYKGTKWPNDSDQETFDNYEREVLETGRVIFSPFLSYTDD